MQTFFTPEALNDPATADAEKIIRSCVHCGMCNATCPTYNLLGDELDGPRGRIYLIKDMLEQNKPATEIEVKHIDRCLTCLSCMTTCPGGVHYGHLVDHARRHIEKTYKRPLMDRLIRNILAYILPYTKRMYWALKVAGYFKWATPIFDVIPLQIFKRMAAMLKLAPTYVQMSEPVILQPKLARKVLMLKGCAQPVLKPEINAATIELLNKFGVEVIDTSTQGCCGALVHHMGKVEQAHAQALNNINSWAYEIERARVNGEIIEAIIITASGCGTSVKDYGHMFKHMPEFAQRAALISNLAKDITEYIATLNLPENTLTQPMTVAYHSACSMQHGQKITNLPKELLIKAGFIVKDVAQGHLCCGSAGVYNIMQSEISQQLLKNKVHNIEATGAQLIATGNIGCITQIATGTQMPIMHTIELLNWAYGGKKPAI